MNFWDRLSPWNLGYVSVLSLGLSKPTYKVDQVPEPFHEYFIVSGYRHPKSTAVQCILSLFYATNETLNFWTHFLPSLYFLWSLCGLSQSVDFLNDPFSYPLLAYLVVWCVFPLSSAIAHTFNTMSVHARHICFFIDYGSNSLFSLAVAVGYRAYIFPEYFSNTLYSDFYLAGAMFNSILCTVCACQTRFMKRSYFRTALRLSAFALPYVYDSVPVIGRLLLCTPEECALSSQLPHARQFIFAITAAFLYATHIPERLNPGKFDIIGHSHQLFHISTAIGVMDQVAAVVLDFQERRAIIKDDFMFASPLYSIGAVTSILVINTCIILLFSYRLIRATKKTN
ncbi:hypothetical protein ScPMuIL_013139 [Solemya velum]